MKTDKYTQSLSPVLIIIQSTTKKSENIISFQHKKISGSTPDLNVKVTKTKDHELRGSTQMGEPHLGDCDNTAVPGTVLADTPVPTFIKEEPPEIPDSQESLDETINVQLDADSALGTDCNTHYNNEPENSILSRQESEILRMIKHEEIEIVNEESDANISLDIESHSQNTSGRQYMHMMDQVTDEQVEAPNVKRVRMKRKRRRHRYGTVYTKKKYKPNKNFTTNCSTAVFQDHERYGETRTGATSAVNQTMGAAPAGDSDRTDVLQDIPEVDEDDLAGSGELLSEKGNTTITEVEGPNCFESDHSDNDDSLPVKSQDVAVCEPKTQSHMTDGKTEHNHDLRESNESDNDSDKSEENSQFFKASTDASDNCQDKDDPVESVSSYSVNDKYASLVKLIEQKSMLLKSFREKFGTS